MRTGRVGYSCARLAGLAAAQPSAIERPCNENCVTMTTAVMRDGRPLRATAAAREVVALSPNVVRGESWSRHAPAHSGFARRHIDHRIERTLLKAVPAWHEGLAAPLGRMFAKALIVLVAG